MDTRLRLGVNSGAGIFHRLTQLVQRTMARRGFTMVVVYLDDQLVVGKSLSECQTSFNVLCELLLYLGFQLSPKLVSRCQCLTFLAVQFDSVNLCLSLPVNKLTCLRAVITTFLQ